MENIYASKSDVVSDTFSEVVGAEFILIGGFLGAGKTTATRAAVTHFRAMGREVGVVTNDQGVGLIDTVQAGQQAGKDAQVSVAEVTGGCFCCRADELVSKLQSMMLHGKRPVILAEPVGSCTDLAATILEPLRQVYNLPLRVAPMSTLLDSRRLADMYFGKPGKSVGFSRDVRYIYLKQMEEADALVMNKTDLLSARDLEKLRSKLKADWPGKEIFSLSFAAGQGVEDWLDWVAAAVPVEKPTMDVDYAKYGEGEALLGWYNAKLDWSGLPVEADAELLCVARRIQSQLEAAGVELAHFKLSLQAAKGISIVNAVRNGCPAEVSRSMAGRASEGEILINLRAEGDPEVLKSCVRQGLLLLPGTLVWQEEAAFRPSQPKPQHRLVKA